MSFKDDMEQLKTWILLLGISLSLPCMLCGSSLPGGFRQDGRSYRDSLRRQVLAKGFSGVDCYLSYPIGSSVLDEGFGDNASALADLCHFLRTCLEDTLVVVRSVSLDGYCSPDGTARFNDRLAYNRVHRLDKYLSSCVPSFRVFPTTTRSHGADWKTLRSLIEESHYIWKQDALNIIDSDISPDRKKLFLAALDGGRAHALIYDLYPFLRRVEVRLLYDVPLTREKMDSYVHPVEAPFAAGEVMPSAPAPVFPLQALPLPVPMASRVERKRVEDVAPQEQNPQPYIVKEPLFALKTNLLFDAMLAPNVEVEVPIGNCWSVMGEYTFPWWLHKSDNWCFEMLQFGLEGRYWLGNRKYLKNGRKRNILTGYFVGTYAGGGYYDFQFNRKSGYQGEFYIAAGLSGGYALRLSKRLNLELSLGLGVLTTKYRAYDVLRDGSGNAELIRRSNGRLLWIGPTKAKVSLVWLLGNKKQGGNQ